VISKGQQVDAGLYSHSSPVAGWQTELVDAGYEIVQTSIALDADDHPQIA
jgi:hypothetical protein